MQALERVSHGDYVREASRIYDVEAKLNNIWARKGSIKIIDVPKNYFGCYLHQMRTINMPFMEGPWMIVYHYILVQIWRSFFLTNPNIGRRLLVWIRIPDLPSKLFNDQFLWSIGTTLGEMLK